MSAKISAALVKAQRAFAPALKTAINPQFKSRYADLSACVEAVLDALNENGIFLMQKQHPNEGGVTIETVFVHESGESISAGLLSVPAAKQDPQGYGSALTYARRYSLMAACGIAQEDDDGNSAKPGINRTLVMKCRNNIAQHVINDRSIGASEEWEAARDAGDEFADAVWSGLTTPERDYVRAARKVVQPAKASA
jgi:hypothetical protein